MTLARLITPEGKTIELPAGVYRQVKRLLDTQPARGRSRAAVASTIEMGYGLLKGDDSLTQALLTERTLDREREDAKFARWDA